MNEWLPLVVGFGGLAIILLILRVFPDSTWSQEARRYVGVQPKGAHSAKTRSDRLKTAGLSAVAMPILFGLAVWSYRISDNYPGLSRSSWAAQTYGFCFFLLGAMAGLVFIGSLFGTLFWRPTVVKSDPDQTAEKLADILALFAEGQADHLVWPDFNAMRYYDPMLESVRARIVADFPGTRPPSDARDAARLQPLISELRARTTYDALR
jgi:hypothetical protein